ncbi:(RS)-norcoclaurine 6-O-methyltransferase-like [Magnolia sinica]|uniref:(RS)-norcoclaurine 6-O-methyltransferase-like n=1 Tax=Magnolia sinica TaxID=86752 RepID=UPI00265B05DA|nr:(RS)-norcoclaurine 6-O-methyltransferase-like [Magnolia sinica]
MEEERGAQAQLWKHIYGFADSLTLKCAIDLGIADIIHKHGGPMTLQELASALPIPTVNIDHFYRIMRYLVHMKLFNLIIDGEKKYTLTPASKLLLKDQDKSLASFALLQYYEMGAWNYLSAAVEGKTTPWEKFHGVSYRDYFEKDKKANQLLSDAMTSHTSMVTAALVRGCQSSGILDGVRSLIDVGGSTGVAARAIAKAFPYIKCAVFDLPHVIATAPECAEVERIKGDMFASIPKTDVVFMKSVLHDWDDEDCIKILKKCKEAIPENGKLVIVDIVMDVQSTYEFTGARLGMEMDMLITVGGKERSEEEWRKLIETAGYSRYKITPIVAIESIIEVFP